MTRNKKFPLQLAKLLPQRSVQETAINRGKGEKYCSAVGKMPHGARVLFAWFAGALLIGCTRDAGPLPTEEEFVGQYLARDGSSFVFSADKKVQLHSVAETFLKASFQAKEPISVAGEWKLEGRNVTIDFAKEEDTPARLQKYRVSVPILRQQRALTLRVSIDAGDAGWIDYEKK